MDQTSTTQSLPSTPKSKRQLIEALVYVLLGLLALAFVILQLTANQKYAAELTEKLQGETFVLQRWDMSASGMLYTRNNMVMLLEDGIAVKIYLDSVKDTYASDNNENSTRSQLQETSTHNEEAATWSVRVSIFNRITIKVGETRFVVHQDKFGMIDYLIEDGYKIYYKRPTFD
ncbi:MAG: hypothetical protein CVV04_10780 [Firmicutes bacterium HGW-Firmicutes-9]|jgi:hypothetical protein|nr:MAG: hypothetical protein CVV04_10780 [Firmicutes bacterium HGW-Firmicutes-9]